MRSRVYCFQGDVISITQVYSHEQPNITVCEIVTHHARTVLPETYDLLIPYFYILSDILGHHGSFTNLFDVITEPEGSTAPFLCIMSTFIFVKTVSQKQRAAFRDSWRSRTRRLLLISVDWVRILTVLCHAKFRH